MKKINKNLIIGLMLLLVFVLFTILVKCVDVEAVGPFGSKVGFSHINHDFFEFFGNNSIWNIISDIIFGLSFLIVFCFGMIGFIQLIKRKNLIKVDSNILILGVFYLILALLYFVFEFVAINSRPVLVDGMLKPSYPSTHDMLSLFIIASAEIQLHKYFVVNKKLVLSADIISLCLLILIVVSRLLSGMHWLTDILGAILIALALLFIYNGVLDHVSQIHHHDKANTENKNV